ncbi:hypothetical protein ANO14919_096750 [Xylariales sp. No.14919]|nr:hypothetical protein ANO14919_096750 [Xylariales sp. No.14919]
MLHRFGALTDQELAQYEIKIQELTNPSGNLYCHSADCGAFIPTTNRKRRVGECVMCSKKTCKACKAKSHFGPCDKAKLEASKRAEDQVYLLAEQKGWKRCPNCLALVQKEGGCNHMR